MKGVASSSGVGSAKAGENTLWPHMAHNQGTD